MSELVVPAWAWGLLAGVMLILIAVDLFARHDLELLRRFTHVGHNIGLETEEEWIDMQKQLRERAGQNGRVTPLEPEA